jgi:hypothetical protein
MTSWIAMPMPGGYHFNLLLFVAGKSIIADDMSQAQATCLKHDMDYLSFGESRTASIS